jgi:hypothetical protein
MRVSKVLAVKLGVKQTKITRKGKRLGQSDFGGVTIRSENENPN